MKVGNAFAQLFAIFSFLTLGSLMIIVSLHLLSFDDAILKLQEIYQDPWRSVQIGLTGLVFIVLGLAFSKMLVKSGRPNEAVIYHSESGPMVVSIEAIQNTAYKTIKRFSLIKSGRVKVIITGKDIEVKLRLYLMETTDLQPVTRWRFCPISNVANVLPAGQAGPTAVYS